MHYNSQPQHLWPDSVCSKASVAKGRISGLPELRIIMKFVESTKYFDVTLLSTHASSISGFTTTVCHIKTCLHFSHSKSTMTPYYELNSKVYAHLYGIRGIIIFS